MLVFPRQRRQPRRARSASAVRQPLDGEEAAVWEETSRVLLACGVSPLRTGRKVREAVSEALMLEWLRSDVPMAAVADLAIRRWQEYAEAGAKGLLFAPLGVKAFFGGGEWLRPGMWHYDREALKKFKRGNW